MIRKAEPGEVDALGCLWHEAWLYGHGTIAPAPLIRLRTPESFAERLAAALPDVFVAGTAGTPSGFFILRGDEIYQFFVARASRGSGFAASLIVAAEAELARRRVANAWLDCAVGNERAARFYEKCGWRKADSHVNRIETAEGVFEVPHWRFEKQVACS
jgi:GNAT superfamily N-acetyltransferase